LIEQALDGIILCRCHGRVTDKVDMDDIVHFIGEMAPDVRVVIGDDLCQPQVLKRVAAEAGLRSVVIGACSDLRPRLRVWEDEAKCPVNPFAARVLPLMEESAAGFTVEEATQRVKLLLWAQVRRARGFKGVAQQNLRMCIEKPAGEIGRRELTAMLLPQYRVVPLIDTSLCSGGLKCSLCRDACPHGAVAIEENTVDISQDACTGCGACVAVCPRGAVSYPTFSLQELDRELEGLLTCPDVQMEPRIVAFTDRGSGCGQNGDGRLRFPLNVLPVKLPSLYMASPLLMLRALAMGAQGLALVHSGEMYRSGAEGEPWRGHIGFVQELLDLWGIGGHRVKLFEMGKDAGDIVQLELGRFVDKIAGLPPTSFASTGDVTPGVEGQQLHELIKWMAGRLPQPAEGRVTSGMVSFGMVKLDGDKCTGCGLCALNCPTDAITVITDSGSDGYSISFKYDLCVGCGVCVNTCPEGCVELDKVLALSELGASPTVLFEDSFIKCHRCGGYVAPRSMMERLKARLQSMGNGEMGWTELCPDCRLSVQLQR
jgi:ferredoxin